MREMNESLGKRAQDEERFRDHPLLIPRYADAPNPIGYTHYALCLLAIGCGCHHFPHRPPDLVCEVPAQCFRTTG